jgi:hypothetical protein
MAQGLACTVVAAVSSIVLAVSLAAGCCIHRALAGLASQAGSRLARPAAAWLGAPIILAAASVSAAWPEPLIVLAGALAAEPPLNWPASSSSACAVLGGVVSSSGGIDPAVGHDRCLLQRFLEGTATTIQVVPEAGMRALWVLQCEPRSSNRPPPLTRVAPFNSLVRCLVQLVRNYVSSLSLSACCGRPRTSAS